MAITIKDLRYRSRQVLQSLKRGERHVITYRGHPVARLVPLSAADKRTFREVGFGMWKNRPDLKDVNQWLDGQRKPRFVR